MSSRRVAIAAAIDMACVLAFVAVGRRNHDEDGPAIEGALRVGAPFLIALAIGWLVAQAWRAPMTMRTGATVWAVTVVGGLLLRRFMFDRGIATPFIIVATLTTALLLLGWRAIAARLERE